MGPRPAFRRMQHHGQGNMPAQTEAEREHDPFADHIGFWGCLSPAHVERLSFRQHNRKEYDQTGSTLRRRVGAHGTFCRLDLRDRNEASKIIRDKVQGLFPPVSPTTFFAPLNRQFVVEVGLDVTKHPLQ